MSDVEISQHMGSPQIQSTGKIMSRFRRFNLFRRRQEDQDVTSSQSPYSDDSQSLSVNNDDKPNNETTEHGKIDQA